MLSVRATPTLVRICSLDRPLITSVHTAVLSRGQKAIVTCRGDAETRLKDLTAKGAAALSLDVTDTPSALAETVRKAHAIYGHLDVLVNNAGKCTSYTCIPGTS